MNILLPNEILMIQMALSATIEDIEISSKDPKLPFTPEARKDMRDMLSTAKSAHQKITVAIGREIRLDPYVDGDEKEFLTKQS